MALEEHIITSLSEIPSLVEAFATSVGWDVTSGPVIRHPDYAGSGPGGIAFSLTSASAGLERDLIWSSSGGIATSRALIRAPILSARTSPFTSYVLSPSRVFLISMLTPEPYIAIVVEFGPNQYRHLYLGFMEKIGDYEGGEVVSACNGMIAQSNSDPVWNGLGGNMFLFEAHQAIMARADSGGVHIDHAENATPWRRFRTANFVESDGIDAGTFDAGEVIGGFGDSVTDHFVAKGKSAIAGASLLVPINLLASVKPSSSVTRFINIGHPAGVRMVNIENMEPLSEVTIGSETWRIFAAIRKSPLLTMARPVGAGLVYRAEETSYNLGYAYRSN